MFHLLRFHLDSAAGGGMVQPCEAAYLASVDPSRGVNIQAPSVTVLVLSVLALLFKVRV
jgi:hypothetical protein